MMSLPDKSPSEQFATHGRARRAALDFYVGAKECVVRAGFGWEIDWQEQLMLERVDECHILREQAWVVLSSGMRAAVVARLFEQISHAFCDWDAVAIRENPTRCVQRALVSFSHPGKINAIAENCRMLAVEGVDAWKRSLRAHGPTWLTRFSYIGPVTCWHLAKNVGMDVVKPDRHLVRMAQASGARDPSALCALFASLTGDRLAVVDLVLWRYATLRPDYVSEIRALKLDEPSRFSGLLRHVRPAANASGSPGAGHADAQAD
ncbi:hypothetical protein WMF11_22620 [Sorangium sp. So ce295]|uniref:hypothetical protein n=1 Tax=Sorangium sp. So ce295 TaxID=3133295 RepID=UPI003F6249F0